MKKTQPLIINLDDYKTIDEKMGLIEGIMDLLEMDWGIDDHTEDKGYPYYFIQIEQKKLEQVEQFRENLLTGKKEKIVETLKNLQAAIKELEDFIEPTNQTSRNWIKELINKSENIKNDLFRIK